MLSTQEITRYSRNILLDEVKRKGQEELKKTKISVIGAGGLGSPILLYLAAAGIGKIQLADFDKIELTNLQRQIIYNTSNIGFSKAETTKQKINELNPHIEVEIFKEKVNKTNVEKLLKNSDLVLEGTDSFETKFLINDTCINLDIPFIIGGILRFEGQVLCVSPGQTACYRCIFENIPNSIPNCSEAGVIGSVAGIIGSIQATEAIKFLLGVELKDFGKLLSLNTKNMELRKLKIQKNYNCPCSQVN